MRTSAYDFARSSPVTLVASAAFGQAPNPTPTPVAPLDAVQDETTPGAPAPGSRDRVEPPGWPQRAVGGLHAAGARLLICRRAVGAPGDSNGNLRLSRATRRHQPN